MPSTVDDSFVSSQSGSTLDDLCRSGAEIAQSFRRRDVGRKLGAIAASQQLTVATGTWHHSNCTRPAVTQNAAVDGARKSPPRSSSLITGTLANRKQSAHAGGHSRFNRCDLLELRSPISSSPATALALCSEPAPLSRARVPTSLSGLNNNICDPGASLTERGDRKSVV